MLSSWRKKYQKEAEFPFPVLAKERTCFLLLGNHAIISSPKLSTSIILFSCLTRSKTEIVLVLKDRK